MAIHNATKLLPLTSQTKLTQTVTLTLTDTVMLISQTKLGFELLPERRRVYDIGRLITVQQHTIIIIIIIIYTFV